MPPPHTIPKYFTIIMRERRGRHYLLWDFGAPPPLAVTILNYLTDRERGGGAPRALPFVGFWRPPNAHPPPSPDATILNYLNDKAGGGGAPLSFVGFWRPPMTPPPLDVTILNYLIDRERGGGAAGIIFCRILAPPHAPLPPTPQYLISLMTERGVHYLL